MFDDLFKERREKQQTRIFKYFQYIFNDNMIIVLLFILGAVAYEYVRWLQVVSGPQYLVRAVVLVVFLLLLSFGRLATYVKEADQMFLMPREAEFGAYMKRSYRYSLLLPYAVNLVLALALYPLFNRVIGWGYVELIAFILSLWLLKAGEMAVRVLENKWQFVERVKGIRATVYVFAFLSLGASLFLSPYLGLVISVIPAVYTLYLLKSSDGSSDWNWTAMVETEENREQVINQILSLFVDVPQTGSKASRRKGLDQFLVKAKDGGNPFAYFYDRLFARSNEWFPLWGRLTIVSLIIACLLPKSWLSVLVLLALLYVNHFQLLPLYSRYHNNAILRTMPVTDQEKVSGFQSLIRRLMLFEYILVGIVYALRNGTAWIYTVAYFVIGLVLIYFLVQNRLPKRLTPQTKGRRRRKRGGLG